MVLASLWMGCFSLSSTNRLLYFSLFKSHPARRDRFLEDLSEMLGTFGSCLEDAWDMFARLLEMFGRCSEDF